MSTLKKQLQQTLGKFGYSLNRKSTIEKINTDILRISSEAAKFNAMRALSSDKEMLRLLESSKSQLNQDIFVLVNSKFKSDGFFVEFGATDGVTLSNSWLLENDYGWKGILAEPARSWHSELRKNRSASIDTRCVWSKSGELINFLESDVGELSTISEFAQSDFHNRDETNTVSYDVETVSLMDLLTTHSAPEYIDYLSIDTEGSEFEILSNFDFESYKFGFISVEHNFTSNRESILELLNKSGYVRVYEEFSSFDDWYVPSLRN